MEDRPPVPGLGRRELLRRGLAVAGAAAIGPRLLGGGQPAALQRVAQVTLPAPPIITRAEWGADESLVRSSNRSFAALEKAIVHHTAIDEVDPAAQVRGILRDHTQRQRFVDIGYTFLVDRAGNIYEGRRARTYAEGEVHDGEDGSGRVVEGAHASGRNRASIGIAILGNYQTTTPVTQESLQSVARIIAWKFGPRDIDPYAQSSYRLTNGTFETFPEICGHKDVAGTTTKTSCPGNGVYSRLPELRDLVAAEIQRGLVGIRILGADGSMWLYGASPSFNRTADIGDVRRNVPRKVPVQAAAGTPTGNGVWIADTNGSIYSFGDAGFHGSLGDRRLNKPIVGLAATPSGNGYWMVASDGGIFTFGDAQFYGSTGAMRLNQPIVGMAPTPSGRGYWLVASDGGIFTFGDARFFGSTGAIRLNEPILGMAAAPDGGGYWMVARDGGLFTFGTARFLGSAVGRTGFTGPAAAMAATPTGAGYWILDSAGAVHGFGDAPVFGGGVTAGSRPALALVPVVRP